jgi:hypothetical protein
MTCAVQREGFEGDSCGKGAVVVFDIRNGGRVGSRRRRLQTVRNKARERASRGARRIRGCSRKGSQWSY